MGETGHLFKRKKKWYLGVEYKGKNLVIPVSVKAIPEEEKKKIAEEIRKKGEGREE